MSNFLFIKVDDKFPEHPQTVGLSDKAFRCVVELWCYCHRHNTDGQVPLPLYKRIPARVRKELEEHYVEIHDGRVHMHDYTEIQQKSMDVEAKRRAGSLGGKAKARNLAERSSLLDEAVADAEQGLLGIGVADGLLDVDVDVDVEKESLRKRKTARSIPADFAVTADMEAWAASNVPSVDIRWETPKFIDWHTARGSLMKDWTAAWRTWMKRAAEQRPAAAAGTKANWW